MTLGNSRYLEIINAGIARGQIRHALFDFDGTLSLIREGWQEVMISMMVELLMQTPQHESEVALRDRRHRICRPADRQTDHLPDDPTR